MFRLVPARAVHRRAGIRLPDWRRRSVEMEVSEHVIVILAYNITDNRRREDVAMLLSDYGPRVQLSVFECDVRSADELRRLRAAIRERIDTLEDQVRLYPTNTQTFAERYIIGARTVEERADYWIVR
jgi:CRISPR-associated protein Cas2